MAAPLEISPVFDAYACGYASMPLALTLYRPGRQRVWRRLRSRWRRYITLFRKKKAQGESVRRWLRCVVVTARIALMPGVNQLHRNIRMQKRTQIYIHIWTKRYFFKTLDWIMALQHFCRISPASRQKKWSGTFAEQKKATVVGLPPFFDFALFFVVLPLFFFFWHDSSCVRLTGSVFLFFY